MVSTHTLCALYYTCNPMNQSIYNVLNDNAHNGDERDSNSEQCVGDTNTHTSYH